MHFQKKRNGLAFKLDAAPLPAKRRRARLQANRGGSRADRMNLSTNGDGIFLLEKFTRQTLAEVRRLPD